MSTWWLTIFHGMVHWFSVRLDWGTGVGKGSTCPFVDVQHRRYTSHFVEPVCDVLCKRRREKRWGGGGGVGQYVSHCRCPASTIHY